MEITPKPGRKPKPEHALKRPPKGTKEKKGLVLGTNASALARAVGEITEGLDHTEALWEALPWEYRTWEHGKATTPQQMVQDLWKNAEHIDLTKAMINLLENEAEDRLIGRANKAANDALVNNPYYKGAVGIGAGPAL